MTKSGQDYSILAARHGRGPTVGTVEYAIMMDEYLSAAERRRALEQLMRDLRFLPPSTPVTPGLLRQLLGDRLADVIIRYLGLGPQGRSIADLTGYGLGSTVYNYYR